MHYGWFLLLRNMACGRIGFVSLTANWCCLVTGIHIQRYIHCFVLKCLLLVLEVVLVPRGIVFDGDLFHLPVKFTKPELLEKMPHFVVILLCCRNISFAPSFQCFPILGKLHLNRASNPADLSCFVTIYRVTPLVLHKQHLDVLT